MSNVDKVLKKFKENPTRIEWGAGKLAQWFKVDKEDVYKARKIYRKGIKKVNKNLPKILIFDIETAPLKAYVWERWNQNIGTTQLISEWFMLTWSAKWLYDNTIYSDTITPDEVVNEDDSRICKSIWKLLNEADIVVAHYGDKFDIPILNGRFAVHGLKPTTPFQSIDTKKVAAKKFKFSSNKLEELAKIFKIPINKLDTDFTLWRGCMEGNPESLKYMQKYNDQDILVLEELYLKIRPWINSHPNVGLYMESDTPVCSNCGSSNLTDTHKHYRTSVGKYRVYQCECGALSRVRQSEYKNKNMVVSIAR